MFQNITSSSLGSDASLEIIAMLLGAFLLGIVFSHILRPCNKKTKQVKAPVIPMSPGKKTDDLQLIEGIGPALEKILQNNGVSSYKDIISLDIGGLEELLESLGGRYTSYNPTTWPDQAELAKRKKWSELEEYQEIMKNSKKKSS